MNEVFTSPGLAMTWESILAYDILIFTLTSVKTFAAIRRYQAHQTWGLAALLFRDGKYHPTFFLQMLLTFRTYLGAMYYAYEFLGLTILASLIITLESLLVPVWQTC